MVIGDVVKIVLGVRHLRLVLLCERCFKDTASYRLMEPSKPVWHKNYGAHVQLYGSTAPHFACFAHTLKSSECCLPPNPLILRVRLDSRPKWEPKFWGRSVVPHVPHNLNGNNVHCITPIVLRGLDWQIVSAPSSKPQLLIEEQPPIVGQLMPAFMCTAVGGRTKLPKR
eukprot:scaffold133258_cov19-Tisochrysis_lutea.AAC.1